MEYEGDTQSRILDAAREFMASPGAAMGSVLDRLYNDRRKTYFVVSAAAFMCLVFAAWRGFGYLRVRSRRSRDYALKNKFLSAMKRRGFTKKPQEGLEEFARAIAAKRGSDDLVSVFAAEFVSSFEEYYFRDIPIGSREFKRLDGMIKNIDRISVRS
jgi:hypothetical protein